MERSADAMMVELTWYESILAGVCGLLRNFEAEKRGFCRTYSKKKDHPVTTNVDAAGAEMAVAKLLNRYWLAGVNTFDSADVAPNIEVRQTARDDGRLIIRPDSPDDRPYVLVRGTIPHYDVVGWTYARDAKCDEYLDDPNGDGRVYMVPADKLQAFRPKEKP